MQAEAEREQLLKQLATAGARYRGLFDGAADSILVIDADGRYIEANPAAVALTGYAADELTARGVGDLTAGDRAAVVEWWARIREAGGWHGEAELRRKDGTVTPVETRLTAVALQGETVYVSAMRDISERRAVERMQNEFLGLVTHELKNPLTGVISYAQLMQRRGAYNERGVEAIVREGRRLERLIDDLLDVSRVEAGRLDLRRDWIDLGPLVRAAVENAQTHSEAHTLELDAPDEPIIGWFDRDRIGQVLQNLLLNAIKYSPDGGPIRVRLAARGEEAEIEIADEGLGIDPEALTQLFGRFYRTEQATSSRLPGLGLGLYITRSLVEAHGGRVLAESAGPGRGSVFTVILPCRPSAARQ
jgi:PAS domain S-box-containing protein